MKKDNLDAVSMYHVKTENPFTYNT